MTQMVEAGLVGDHRKLQLLALKCIRTMRQSDPSQANEMAQVLARSAAGGSALRRRGAPPPPEDSEAGYSLLRFPPTEQALEPELPPRTRDTVRRFVNERRESTRLMSAGIAPPRTVLLKGAPGTGKTMLSSWLAKELGLPLVVLDLATSISSYLGKTGSNLRRILDYGRATPCLMLLDEFDSIAKRRDDASDVGELKRIVNVLLKELEDWPMHSVLVGATNHPDILDPAIHRRFDLVVHLPLPGAAERIAILRHTLEEHENTLPPGFLAAVSGALADLSGSDLTTLANAALRRHLVADIPLAQCMAETIDECCQDGLPRPILGNLVRGLKKERGMTVRKIAEILGKGSSTIQYHLKKEKAHA